MPREAAPPHLRGFRDYWREQLASDELFLTDEARYIGYATAFEIPLPRLHQPGKRVHDLLMLGSLPRARARALRPALHRRARRWRSAPRVRAVRAAGGSPRVRSRAGWNTRSFDMVASDRAPADRARRADAAGHASDGPGPLPRRLGSVDLEHDLAGRAALVEQLRAPRRPARAGTARRPPGATMPWAISSSSAAPISTVHVRAWRARRRPSRRRSPRCC